MRGRSAARMRICGGRRVDRLGLGGMWDGREGGMPMLTLTIHDLMAALYG
jgi:hypothetical protein